MHASGVAAPPPLVIDLGTSAGVGDEEDVDAADGDVDGLVLDGAPHGVPGVGVVEAPWILLMVCPLPTEAARGVRDVSPLDPASLGPLSCSGRDLPEAGSDPFAGMGASVRDTRLARGK